MIQVPMLFVMQQYLPSAATNYISALPISAALAVRAKAAEIGLHHNSHQKISIKKYKSSYR